MARVKFIIIPFFLLPFRLFFNLTKKKKIFREPEGSIGSEFNFQCAIDWAARSFVKKRTDKRILYYLLQLDKHPTSLRRNQAESAFSMSFDEGLLLLSLILLIEWIKFYLTSVRTLKNPLYIDNRGRSLKPLLPWLIFLTRGNDNVVDWAPFFSLLSYSIHLLDYSRKTKSKWCTHASIDSLGARPSYFSLRCSTFNVP